MLPAALFLQLMKPKKEPITKMKTTLRLLICIVAILQFGCETMSPQWRATGTLLVEKAAALAVSTVLNSAVSPADRQVKQDFLHSAATGLRSTENTSITSDDIAKVINIWTPEKNHWKQLAADAAVLFATEQSKGTSQDKIIEMLAQGLQKAASSP